MSDEAEVRAYLRAQVQALEALSWEELGRYGAQWEYLTTKSGTRYRVTTRAYWDAYGAWAGGLEVSAKARAPSGWCRWWAFRDGASRGGLTDPVPNPPADWKAPSRSWLPWLPRPRPRE